MIIGGFYKDMDAWMGYSDQAIVLTSMTMLIINGTSGKVYHKTCPVSPGYWVPNEN